MFDSWVVARTKDHEILFFEKPLIKSGKEAPMTLDLNNITMTWTFGTFEFAIDINNDTRCFMYGVNSGSLYKYTFEVNLEMKSVLLREEQISAYGSFTGKHYDSVTTLNYFIVSCADCSSAEVVLFDLFTLEKVQSYDMGSASNDTINLAVYEENKRNM